MEPQVNPKHKANMGTRNIVILVLVGIVLLSAVIFLIIPLFSDKSDTIQPDEVVQDIPPDETDTVSSLQDPQKESSNVPEKSVAKKEVKPQQSPVEPQKQPKETEKKINLTGRWLTDENLEWKIVQSGDEVEISMYNKRGNPTIVQGTINGNTLSYRKPKPGNDLEGQFTISKDGNSLDGVEYKVAGIKNRLKITRLP
jgi:hypothetical protein